MPKSVAKPWEKRMRYDRQRGDFLPALPSAPFIAGPIDLGWLSDASSLPGKAINVALAICWLSGMNKGKSFVLTKLALDRMHVARDAARDGLRRLELGGLVQVERSPGRRPRVLIVHPAK